MCLETVAIITRERLSLEHQVRPEEAKEAFKREFHCHQVIHKDLIFVHKSIILHKIIFLAVQEGLEF